MRAARWMAVTAVTLVMTVTAGCGGRSSSSSPSVARELDRNGTLRVAMHYSVYPLDPHTPGSPVAAYPYVSLLYDRLTRMGPNLKLEPMLATSWEFTPDGKTVTFHLREGVTFSDGTPVDAEAVRASLDRARNLPQSTVKGYLNMIERVEVVDPLTVRIVANRPAADLPYILSSTEGAIISPRALQNPDLDRNPVGSGPYVLTEFQLNERAVFTRREGYWDPEAAPAARIEMVNLTNDSARLSALRSGQYDMALMKLSQYEQLGSLPDRFTTKYYPPAPTYTVGLNTARPNIDNKLVRQAMNWAIDREAINKSLLGGQCAPLGQPLSQLYPGHLTNPPISYGYDPEKARRLLAEAGVPNGFKMRMLVGANLSPENQMAAAVQAQLAQVGIDVEIVALAGAQLYPSWTPGSEYEGFINTRPSRPTAAMTLESTFLVPTRYPGPVPPAFREAVQRAFDPNLSEAELRETLERASAIAVEEALDLYICAVPTVITYADNVIGAEDMGQSYFQGIPDLRYVGVAARD